MERLSLAYINTCAVLKQAEIEIFVCVCQMLWENGINGILADEMGLGKTIQCIGHIAMMLERKVLGPFLVVAPLSTVPNWISEFNRFTPEVSTQTSPAVSFFSPFLSVFFFFFPWVWFLLFWMKCMLLLLRFHNTSFLIVTVLTESH